MAENIKPEMEPVIKETLGPYFTCAFRIKERIKEISSEEVKKLKICPIMHVCSGHNSECENLKPEYFDPIVGEVSYGHVISFDD